MDDHAYNQSYNDEYLRHHNDNVALYLDDDLLKQLNEYYAMDRDRNMFSIFYQVFAACIVVLNVILVVSILISRKQRRHFRNWLILHMTVINILYGGIACPFMGRNITESNAGLDTVLCKLLYFITDTLEYTANVSLAILGLYQCITMLSPRMLKGVSHALLTSIMIIVPWVVCVMLTAVLRLTMSEEHLGQCYTISDRTAQVLWLILAYGLPLLLIFVCFISLIAIACSPLITHIDSSPPGRQNMTVFVGICLGTFFLMRTPFYFIYANPISVRCFEELGFLLCTRVTHGLDLIRLTNMVLIPLAYLIPTEIRKCFKKLKSKLLCKRVSSTSTKQRMEMVTMSQSERTIV